MTDAIPHFALPFQIANGAAAVNEQDSTDDIEACVLAIASFPIGSRIERPDFGVPDQTFRQGGVDAGGLAAAIRRWEPRADATVVVDNSDLVHRVSSAIVSTKESS